MKRRNFSSGSMPPTSKSVTWISTPRNILKPVPGFWTGKSLKDGLTALGNRCYGFMASVCIPDVPCKKPVYERYLLNRILAGVGKSVLA